MLRISFCTLFSIFHRFNPIDEKICLVDSGTTNSILRKIKYFQTLIESKRNILIIVRCDAVIAGSGRAIVMLPMGTMIIFKDALLYPNSTHTLLSYRDICKNGYHIETHDQNNEEFLLITKDNSMAETLSKEFPHLRLDYCTILT